MLQSIYIQNYKIINELEIDFSNNFTAISGETGTGKSVIFDAINLILGNKASSNSIKHQKNKAEIIANFNISNQNHIIEWLKEKDLFQDEILIIRRVITNDSKNKSYINGILFPLTHLKELGSMLIDFHGQHESQLLLKKHYHTILLDTYAQTSNINKQVKNASDEYHENRKKINEIRRNLDEQYAKKQLLEYQLNEIEQLDLKDNELEELEDKHKFLNNNEENAKNINYALSLISESENTITKSISILSKNNLNNLQNSLSMLEVAKINIQETYDNLKNILEKNKISDNKDYIEKRLMKIYNLSKKHKIQTKDLNKLKQQIIEDLEELESLKEELSKLETKSEKLSQAYYKVAKNLSNVRYKAQFNLCMDIEKKFKILSMNNAKFKVKFKENLNQINPNGLEHIEFFISTQKDTPFKEIIKIASGGEISRIILAIEVINAKNHAIKTLIFDEIDSGIGGKTAQNVGALLRELGENVQVIAITHLPQVAAFANQHLITTNNKKPKKYLINASQNQRIEEIARMISGTINETSLKHAKELLNL